MAPALTEGQPGAWEVASSFKAQGTREPGARPLLCGLHGLLTGHFRLHSSSKLCLMAEDSTWIKQKGNILNLVYLKSTHRARFRYSWIQKLKNVFRSPYSASSIHSLAGIPHVMARPQLTSACPQDLRERGNLPPMVTTWVMCPSLDQSLGTEMGCPSWQSLTDTLIPGARDGVNTSLISKSQYGRGRIPQRKIRVPLPNT